MSPKKILLAQFDLHNALYNNVLDNITEEESDRIASDGMNTIKWLAGHLLWAQLSLGNIGNIEVDIPWRGYFHSKEGAVPADNVTSEKGPPTLHDIRNKWNELNPLIRSGLENLNEDDLTLVLDIKHPLHPFDNTIAGLWAFTNHHQAYTIGQISILRKWLGRESMSYRA